MTEVRQPAPFTPFTGVAGCTSYRSSIIICPVILSLCPKNKSDDGFVFTNGEDLFTVYTRPGFSEDPEPVTNWDSSTPTHLHVGASLGAPTSEVERFIAYLKSIDRAFR